MNSSQGYTQQGFSDSNKQQRQLSGIGGDLGSGCQSVIIANHQRCECHECTQARWKMFSGALGSTR